ncbi:TetR/AcrR family transcriptional regulator [Actinoplanes couchii]|uniref:HTH tetR-type domain-containing protein n=1 Tax=Actinoplanes couchii TaxID=403638 RepID=A0ABQ3X8P0_9ACTN|nr:TetR/AcrR family transcriptional regulator [Actinoplanes couchii]MDR6320105.1 AcrR family transcriptional regulator [Actinoplanes couchii]GID54880.1 hypothetical protein Aco03nite_032840 [Actinoplanes couchii]
MTPRPPASERLDRAELLTAALHIADTDGLDAVTLRRVATAFNVTPMALYWHFKDKNALLDALVERVLSELSGEPDLRTEMTALLHVLRAHPTLADLMPIRLLRTEPGLRLADRVIGLLRAAGHTPEAAAQLSIFLLTGLISLVTNQPGEMSVPDPAQRESLLAEKRAKLKSLSPQTYPHLTETVDFFLGLPDEDAYYSRGIALLLDGAAGGGPVSSRPSGGSV